MLYTDLDLRLSSRASGWFDCLKRSVFCSRTRWKRIIAVRSCGEEFCQGKYLSGVSGIVYKQIGVDGNAIVPDRYRERCMAVSAATLGADRGFSVTCPAGRRIFLYPFHRLAPRVSPRESGKKRERERKRSNQEPLSYDTAAALAE